MRFKRGHALVDDLERCRAIRSGGLRHAGLPQGRVVVVSVLLLLLVVVVVVAVVVGSG